MLNWSQFVDTVVTEPLATIPVHLRQDQHQVRPQFHKLMAQLLLLMEHLIHQHPLQAMPILRITPLSRPMVSQLDQMCVCDQTTFLIGHTSFLKITRHNNQIIILNQAQTELLPVHPHQPATRVTLLVRPITIKLNQAHSHLHHQAVPSHQAMAHTVVHQLRNQTLNQDNGKVALQAAMAMADPMHHPEDTTMAME